MQVIIPEQDIELVELLKSQKSTNAEFIRKSVRPPGLCENVKLQLPKFKIESTIKLDEALKQVRA